MIDRAKGALAGIHRLPTPHREVIPALDWLSILVALPVLVLVTMGIRAQIAAPWDGMEWIGTSFEVVRVEPGGPAEKAGVLVGDVVVGLDGVEPVAKIPLYSGGPGSTLAVTVRRGDSLVELEIVLGEMPLRHLGIRLVNLATALLFSVLSLAFTVGARRSRSGVFFTLFYQLLAATIACGTASGLHHDWAIRGFQASVALISPASLYMASSFPLSCDSTPMRAVRGASVVVAGILLLPVVFLPGPALLGGVGYMAYRVSMPVLLLNATMSVAIIAWSFDKSPDASSRAATRISLLGLVLAVTPLLGLYLVPRILLGRADVSPELALLFLTFLPVYHGFSITRRRFGRLESVLPSVSTAAIGGAFLMFVLLGSVWLTIMVWPDGGERALRAGIMVGVVIAAVGNTAVSKASRRLVLSAFYGRAYDYQSIVSEISRDLAQAVSRDELGKIVVETLCSRMNLIGAALLSTRTSSESLVLEAIQGGEAADRDPRRELAVDGPLASTLARHERPLAREALQTRIPAKDLNSLERSLLEDERVALWVPVIVKGVLRGIVMLGQKRKDALYSRDDVEIAATLAGQIGVGMENADLYDHLRAEMRKLQEMQAQLVQAEKLSAVGELVSGVAHELNNPLTAVIGYAELLRAETTDEQAISDLDNILRSAERSRHIVRNLLTFARRQSSERRLVSLNDILTQTVEIQAYQLRVDNVTVVSDLDPNLPYTAVDNSQMQQVFLNIIMNAHQAIRSERDRGTIHISTRVVRPGTIRVSIADDGPGIASEVASKLFDPFFTTKEVGVGTGLGLSICYGIVSSHSGRIWADSAPGAGATFHIELPVQSVAAAPEKPSESAVEIPAGLKVLIVEDETAVAAVLNRLLTKRGCVVEAVSNAADALELLRDAEFDVIISDVRMPGMSGAALWERMKAEFPAQADRVVFVTGDTASSETGEFLRAVGQPVLAKPFGAGELARALAALKTAV